MDASKNIKIMNTQFQKKAERRWAWSGPDGNTKNEIDYIMSDKPSLVSDVTVINCINIGRDHMMVLGYTRSDVVSIAQQAKKQTKTKISSPTRAIMKKRREMIEEKSRDHMWRYARP